MTTTLSLNTKNIDHQCLFISQLPTASAGVSLRSSNPNLFTQTRPPKFLNEAQVGLTKNPPQLCDEGTGGTYFLTNLQNKNIAVFKPADEDPLSYNNPKYSSEHTPHFKGILPGEGASREVFAYEIDRGFAKIPETLMVNISHWVFTGQEGLKQKQGSFQKFVSNTKGTAEEFGSSLFSVEDVHRIAMLDLLLVNCDRNGGNFLVTNDNQLVPIDHSFCLPDYRFLTDLQWFEWMNWRQSKLAITDSAKQFLFDFDISSAIKKARQLNIREECIWTMRLSHSFLLNAVRSGKTLYEIGKLMCSASSSNPSEFATAVIQAVTKLKSLPDVNQLQYITENPHFHQLTADSTKLFLLLFVLQLHIISVFIESVFSVTQMS